MLREAQPVDITPIEFEKQVKAWLEQTAGKLVSFQTKHRSQVSGNSGEYEIDVEVTFEVFDGAKLRVLVECKRYRSPVKRDVVVILEGKLRDIGAHKGMVFSTSGFQKGALQYADNRGIATITVQDGKTNYHTKSRGKRAEPPPWVKLSKFIGWFVTGNGAYSLIDDDRIEPFETWLQKE